MSKRRTRKEKEKARHNFVILQKTYQFEPKTVKSEADVKRQFQSASSPKPSNSTKSIRANPMGQISNLISIKRDILKSLSLAVLIFASEIVIYLFWH